MPAFVEVQRYASHSLIGPLVLIALGGAWLALLAVGTAGTGFSSPLHGGAVWLGVAVATAAASGHAPAGRPATLARARKGRLAP